MALDITSYEIGKKAGGGGDTPTGTINITENGITNVSSYATADVNVQPDLETKSITITENTTTTITPTTGKDGLSSVEVITNVSGGGDIETQEKLKTAINYTGAGITDNDPFTEYPGKLKEGYVNVINQGIDYLYDNLPQVSQTGTEISLSPTYASRLKTEIKGNTEQITYVNVGTWEQGSISSSTGQDSSDSNNVRTQDYIPVEHNVLYSISRSIYNKSMNFRFYDVNKNYLGYQNIPGIISNRAAKRMKTDEKNMTIMFTNVDIAYMRLTDGSNNTSTIYTIAKESTPSVSEPVVLRSATAQQEIRIKGGENYWHYSASGTNNGVDYNFNGSEIFLNGRTTFSNFIYSDSSNKITIPAGNYILSTKILSGSFTCPAGKAAAMYLNYSGAKEMGGSSSNFTEETEMIFSSDTEAYFSIYANSSDIRFNNLKIEIKLEKFETQTLDLGTRQLRKVGQYQDYIARNVSSTGTVSWVIHRQIGNIDSYNGETITTDYISSTGALTTGANINYVLENETTETITTALRIKLNEIYNIQSYDGETDILITSDTTPILMTASALKKDE